MRLAFLGVLLLAALAPLSRVPACAATPVPTTASFQVSATVVLGCWVVGNTSQTSGIQFGTLDFGSHPAMQAGTYSGAIGLAGSPVQVECTPNTAVSLAIDGGLHVLDNQRRMRNGSHFVAYTLTTQPGGGTVLHPGVGVTMDVSGGAAVLPVYGQAVTPGAGVPGGLYTDVLQVLISW